MNDGRTLYAFNRSLRLEAHNLLRRPELTWQQLYNRLQWAGDALRERLEPEFERRTAPGAQPWLQSRTRFREPEALVRILDTGQVVACAFSPDGERICSASQDGTLRLWGARSGKLLATLPALGAVRSVGTHPHQPLVACGDSSGRVYLFELKGIEYGPIVVTATDLGSGPAVRCPACWHENSLEPDRLGSDVICQREGCGLNLRVNTFVLCRRDGPSSDIWSGWPQAATRPTRGVLPVDIPLPQAGTDPERAYKANRKYQEEVARWTTFRGGNGGSSKNRNGPGSQWK